MSSVATVSPITPDSIKAMKKAVANGTKKKTVSKPVARAASQKPVDGKKKAHKKRTHRNTLMLCGKKIMRHYSTPENVFSSRKFSLSSTTKKILSDVITSYIDVLGEKLHEMKLKEGFKTVTVPVLMKSAKNVFTKKKMTDLDAVVKGVLKKPLLKN